jgi:hypothetical protein
VERDGQLLFPSIWLALQETETQGLGVGGRSLKALAEKFPESPEPLRVLATLYSSAGYRVERADVVRELAKRFPDDPQALTALLEVHEELGEHAKADEVAARLERVMPGSEIKLTRALARRDYAGAVAELERLQLARPDRADIVGRIADLLVRSGGASESLEKLERAVADAPADAQARLALADARYAAGQGNALTEGIVEALRSGADPAPLREAVELVEGGTALEAFRLDTRKVLAEFDASRVKLPGGAARVLDYGAMRVFPDGSFRMLEHEIIRIQDASGIQSQAETPLPRGWILKLRVLKKDGRVLEPELIEGKPTVTMPHLEVGDAIETESISSYRGDGTGRRFDGPRWYFREEGLPYYRSEFVVVAPEHRSLDVETTGAVPPPTKSTSGGLVTLRYRVDESPALPVEPAMAPLSEFLPSVRVGWGLSRTDTLARLIDAAADLTPLDPRLRRVATKEAGTGSQAERAARLYRYVMQTVQTGRESDPRRVLFGKSGSRLDAFRYLCRLAGIESTLAIARDRLAPPAKGRLSEAEVAGGLLLRLELDGAPRWLELRSDLAPFGYVPSSYRGQRAWLLRDEGGEELVPDEGSPDLVSYTGKGTLSADGGLDLELEQSFVGRLAIDLRGELRSVAAAELQQDVEASLARTFPGAALRELEVLGLDEVDKPLTLRSKLRISAFGKPTSAGFALTIPPFVRLAPVATLPARETAIYVSERLSKDVRVSIRLTLPPQAKVASSLAPAALGDGPRSVKVSDRVEGRELVFDRTIVIPPGRIQPAEYPSFRTFATDTDAALGREIEIEVARSSP